MPAMMCAWFLYQVVSSFAAAQLRLYFLPYIMQSTDRNTNKSLWGDKTTPLKGLCTHRYTHKHTQLTAQYKLFTWPLQTFQRSSSGGKWSSRASYHSQSCIYLPMFPSPLTELWVECVCMCVRVCVCVHLDFSFSPKINWGWRALRCGL